MSRPKRKRSAPKAAQITERIEAERRKLQKASAVLLALIYALERGLAPEQVEDVASTALDLVEQAIAALDHVALKRPDGAP